MRFVIFCHSLKSCWNHGNAHFLRGVVSELVSRGHEVRVWEPAHGWSRENLVRDHGEAALHRHREAYPGLDSAEWGPGLPDLDVLLDGADVVLVHEWSDHALVERIGRHRAAGGRYVLLFHDTHHRSVSSPEEMARYDLSGFDGVLAFGECIRELYVRRGWARRAFTWHEAADVRVFRPLPGRQREGDLVWVGNWGDGEREQELREFLLEPSRRLALRTSVYGVRYPDEARAELDSHGVHYGGWAPNHEVPELFARHAVTVHVPRGPYVRSLPGIPTIRPFEALACGIPLVSAPWQDAEGLFRPGHDFLVARCGEEMKRHLSMLLADAGARDELARRGRETLLARHTCAHRVDELMHILSSFGRTSASTTSSGTTTTTASTPSAIASARHSESFS